MNIFDDPCCWFNVKVLALFTHTSYQSALSSITVTSIATLCFLSAVVFQVMLCIETGLQLRTIVDVVPSLVAITFCLLFMCIAYGYRHRYEQLIRAIERQTEEIRYGKEEDIIESYNKFSRMFVMIITVAPIGGSISIPLLSVFPRFLDLILPLNETRKLQLPFRGKYFFDEEEHFYLVLLYQYVTILLVVFLISSAENVFFLIIQYACTSFAITGYRMSRIIEDDNNIIYQNGMVEEAGRIVRTIESCIQTHLYAIEYISTVQSSVNEVMFLMLVLTVISISVQLVQLSNPDLLDTKSLLYIICVIGQCFFLNYGGQLIVDEGIRLGDDVYNARWYNCPADIQRLFVVLIMRSRKICSINVNNMFILSMQTFNGVAQTAMSYCMVLRQMQ